jgi:hypothetical protein
MLRDHKIVIIAWLALLVSNGAQQPPVYQIDRSVIANGGGTSSAGGFRIDGTIGQSAAGEQMSGGSFNQVGGFWQPLPLAPTAASVTMSGRVLTRNGRAVSRALVAITDIRGNRRFTLTNTFGYFRISDIGAGELYLVEVSARAYTFDPRLISVGQDVTGLTITALP